jgi:T5SS/PEP-CTERM-associated repeat protein
MVVGGTMTSTTIDILQNGELTTGLLLIGSEGVAVMDNHGFVNTDGSAVLGVNESGDGQAIVWGVDAEWAVNGILTIGGAGHGSLDVTGGSVVRMIGGEIARDNGSTGEMHIDAAQVISESSTADDFNVGIHGQASLSLHGGQLDIVNGNVFVGRGKGSDATVNVDGASKMTANRDFIIAANEGVLGSPSNATVNVTDGSTLEVTESLLVGENGVGALNVSNSDVNSRVGRIGIAGGSTGRVSLLDARWSITEYLSVGENGIGELMVTDGGVINSKRSLIATNANGQGAVQMSNGVWTSNDLTVGENGVGSFEAVQFSMVEINDGMIGRNDGSIGTIILSQSSLVSGGPERADFEVGLHGEATMSLFASSARIDHGNLFIGRGRGSTGTVNVDISSILSINGDVIIAAGEGEGESRSNATVNVTNGSVLETPHGLLVGENGIGALNVSGSDVISRIGRIGVTDGSEGSVSLVGASNWTIGESLIVGEEGAGTLSVSDYSFVQIDSLLQVGNEGLVDLVLSEGRINIGGGGLPADVGILRVGDGGLLAGGGIINGNVVVDGGSISPGFSPGMLTIDGDLSITALGSLSIEIGGETPGLDNDVLDVTGNIDSDGTIFITLIDGYRPGRGDVFNLLHFGGDFDPLSLSQIVFTNGPAGFEYELGLTSGVASVVVTVPEVGSLSFLGVASVFVGLAVRYRHKCV